MAGRKHNLTKLAPGPTFELGLNFLARLSRFSKIQVWDKRKIKNQTWNFESWCD